MQLFVLSRHAHSVLNLEGRVNGDPTVRAPLSEEGRAQADRLGDELRHLPLDLCVHTRFPRTRETADIALRNRAVPQVEEPLLDDVHVGDLDGVPVEEYRAWKKVHRRDEPFPGGESLDDAARRYARGFRRLLERPEERILVVAHEIPIRYALNGADGSNDLDGPEHAIPNATPYLFTAEALRRSADRIDEIVKPS
ncbi:MAG TPA: histidine phosphatase family protein [Gaiellaceae bacterium]|nr:histidine phosphatase family protein [Gaiellaceae bacterium]